LDIVIWHLNDIFSSHPSELSSITFNTLSEVGLQLDKLEEDSSRTIWQQAFILAEKIGTLLLAKSYWVFNQGTQGDFDSRARGGRFSFATFIILK